MKVQEREDPTTEVLWKFGLGNPHDRTLQKSWVLVGKSRKKTRHWQHCYKAVETRNLSSHTTCCPTPAAVA